MAERLAEDLWRLDIPLVGNPLKNLNSYLLTGERSLLIDTGFRQQSCREAMERQLAETHVDRDRLDIFCTHLHSDHTGLAPELIAHVKTLILTGATAQKIEDAVKADPGFAKSVHLISGFKNEDGIVFHSELEAWKEKFSTIYALDNDAKEGWRTGLVTTFVKEIPFDSFDGDYAVVVVGPPPMMKFTGLELMNNGVDAEKVWMSFERKMSCAVGKCGHCRIDEVYVCLDGPVFPYTVARDLVD